MEGINPTSKNLVGVVISNRMTNTAKVLVRYLSKSRKYKLYSRERRCFFSRIPTGLNVNPQDRVEIRYIGRKAKNVFTEIVGVL